MQILQKVVQKCGTISDFKEKSINECKRKDVKVR